MLIYTRETGYSLEYSLIIGTFVHSAVFFLWRGATGHWSILSTKHPHVNCQNESKLAGREPVLEWEELGKKSDRTIIFVSRWSDRSGLAYDARFARLR